MEIPGIGDYVVVVMWNKRLIHTKYVRPSWARAQSILAATRMDRLQRESSKKRGARPRAFMAKIEAEG